MTVQNATPPASLAASRAAASLSAQQTARSRQAPDAPAPDLSHIPPAARTLPARNPVSPQNLDSAAGNLANLRNTEILMDEVIVLFLQSILQKREGDREQIMADGALKMEAHQNAAHDIRDGAVAALAGSVVQGTISVAAGAASAGGAARASVKGGLSENPMAFQNKMTQYQFLNQTATGTGQMVDGGMQYVTKEKEAEKEMDDSEADQAGSIQESNRADASEDLQYVQGALQTFEKIEESRHEGMIQATQA